MGYAHSVLRLRGPRFIVNLLEVSQSGVFLVYVVNNSLHIVAHIIIMPVSWVIGSAVEHLVYTEGVSGSNSLSPTMYGLDGFIFVFSV